MLKNNYITIGLLILLTIITSIVSMYGGPQIPSTLLIILLSGLKFLLVAFLFMELRKAHNLWKGLLIGYLVLISTILYILI